MEKTPAYTDTLNKHAVYSVRSCLHAQVEPKLQLIMASNGKKGADRIYQNVTAYGNSHAFKLGLVKKRKHQYTSSSRALSLSVCILEASDNSSSNCCSFNSESFAIFMYFEAAVLCFLK